MQILNRLTIRNLKLNKKRTIVTIIGIILATALLTAVATMAVSLKESITLREKKVDGDFHLLLYDMTDKEKESVINNRQVESYYEMHEIGYAVLEDCVNDSKPYVYIEALDNDTFEKAEINVTSGRLPEDDSEIVISSHIKTNGGVKYNLGDEITFDIGDRTYNGKKLYQNDDYREDELLDVKQTKTYKVVGICDRLPYGEEPRTAPGYSVITFANKSDTSLNKSDIYIRFYKKVLKDRYNITADILGVDRILFNKQYSGSPTDEEAKILKNQLDKAHSYYINNSLIKYEAFYDSSVAFVYNMAVVMVIIIITSAVCISNSFAISINQKTKQYGMLASIGATPRQIRKNVFFEAAFIGVIGVAAGIVGGLSASYILVILSNKMLIDTLEMSIVYAPSLLGVLLSIVLAIVTIVLSALVPSIRASRMSPIMAINHSEDIKIKSKSLRTPKLVGKIWGEGGVLAYKNMKRNKRKYRVITISIALSVMTFIALYGFMSLLTDSANRYANGNIDLRVYMSSYKNMSVDEADKKVSNIVNRINNETNITDFTFARGFNGILRDKPKYSADYYEMYNYERGLAEPDNYYINIISLGNEEYEKYIKKLGISKETAQSGGILVDNTYQYINNGNNVKYFNVYDGYKAGDILTYQAGNAGRGQSTDNNRQSDNTTFYDIKIVALSNERPFGYDNAYTSYGYLIVSDDYMNQFNPRDIDCSVLLNINCDDPDKAQDILVNEFDIGKNNIVNAAQERRNNENLILTIKIFLYGFIAVVSLIGITNIFNTVTTGMELRGKEFAMLQSIGMTKREFDKMIRMESVFYGSKALIIGVVSGTLLSYVIYISAGESQLRYVFPLPAIVIAVVVVIILLLGIMKYSLVQIRKQNIIETIRNENI
jgi:putative ABC transport system permease protein